MIDKEAKESNQNTKPAKLKTQQELINEIIQGLREAITGKTVPLSALFEEVDAD